MGTELVGVIKDLHVVPVLYGADAEEEDGGGHQLVGHTAPESEVMTRERPEYRGSVRRDPVPAPVVLVEHDRLPVHQEHDQRAQEGSDVLRQEIERDLLPGELAESGESHSDGGVDVAPGDLTAEEDTEDCSNAPSGEMETEVTVVLLSLYLTPS